MEAESMNELRLVMNMNASEEVIAFRHQPITLELAQNGSEVSKYTPDFVVRYADGAVAFREVKTLEEFGSDPSLSGRLERIVDQCRIIGASFEVWTENRDRPEGSTSTMVIRLKRQ